LQWLAGWHYSISELPTLLLAAVGLLAACHPAGIHPFPGRLCHAALRNLLCDPYKTPWCAAGRLYALAALAGIAVAALFSRWRAATGILPAAVVLGLGLQAWFAAMPYATGQKNPWVYAQTGPRVFVIRDRVEALARTPAEGRNVPIDIYTRQNLWPLPWYLRRFPQRPLVDRGDPRRARRAHRARLPGNGARPGAQDLRGTPPGERELYMNLFPTCIGLRPQVETRGYVAKSLWDRQP
jgi:hypothetical protein